MTDLHEVDELHQEVATVLDNIMCKVEINHDNWYQHSLLPPPSRGVYDVKFPGELYIIF